MVNKAAMQAYVWFYGDRLMNFVNVTVRRPTFRYGELLSVKRKLFS